jgi:hypothetical protein
MKNQNYVRHDVMQDYHHGMIWRNFCRSVVYEQRFFNSQAKELIAELFQGVEAQRDHHKLPPVYELKPGEPLATMYRARLAETDAKRSQIVKDPAKELTAPPERLRKPGRMNPSGVACFYGAYELETCIAELRPVVGSIVVGAKFKAMHR